MEGFFKKSEKKETEGEAFNKIFSQQWEVQRMEVSGEQVRYIDIQPEEISSETPVLFVPGWGRSANSYKDLLGELYKKGKRIVSVEYPRWSKEEQEEDLPAQQRKANTLLSFIEQLHIGSVDVLSHSEGGMNAILAADKDEQKFRNFVLVDSGGYSKMSFGELLRNRTKIFASPKAESPIFQLRRETNYETGVDYSGDFHPSDEQIELVKKRKKDVLKDIAYSARNPIRIVAEAVESLQVEIPGKLQKLKDNGHEISLIHGVNDHVSKSDDLQENINTDMVTGVYVVRGDHSDMSLYPESYGIVATSAIEALEQKSLQREVRDR